MENRSASALALAITMYFAGAATSTAQTEWQPIPASAAFSTGDSWSAAGHIYRLFGVQACIRGTNVTGKDGTRRDCGDLSLKMLAGLVKAWNPICAVVAVHTPINYVVCYADINASGTPRRIELGTALISSGFAFAARNNLGGPASISYWAAEQEAKKTSAGLWAYPDLPNPNDILLKALKKP